MDIYDISDAKERKIGEIQKDLIEDSIINKFGLLPATNKPG